jgi:hypothetical protein
MNERRRLESKAIIARTRQTSEELMKCVEASRTLVAESALLLQQSSAAAAYFHVYDRAISAEAITTGVVPLNLDF